jgi:hypothetical protein
MREAEEIEDRVVATFRACTVEYLIPSLPTPKSLNRHCKQMAERFRNESRDESIFAGAMKLKRVRQVPLDLTGRTEEIRWWLSGVDESRVRSRRCKCSKTFLG